MQPNSSCFFFRFSSSSANLFLINALHLQFGNDLPEYTINALSKITNSCFVTTIVIHNLHDGSIRQLNLFLEFIAFIEGVFFFKLWNEVILRNVHLFNGKVGWNIDYFDSVEERAKHVLIGVRGTNEYTLTKIELNIKVVVSELIGLLWIQKFQKS